MADNVGISTGTGATIASDDIGGVQYQRTKAVFGVDGVATDVSASNPLPTSAVGDVASGTADAGNPIKVGGRASATAPTAVAAGSRVDAWNDLNGRRVVSDMDIELGLTTGITSYKERVVAPRYTVLSDSIADGLATFWTTTTANGGTVTVATGEGSVSSSTATNGSAQIVSTAVTYLPGQSHWFLAAAYFGDTGSAGNIRRIGAFTVSGTTPQEGFYFELNGTTFNAVSVKGGVATPIAVGSWSRNSVAPFTLDANYHLLEARYTANRADFYIDNVLRHSATVTNSAITGTLNFPMTVQSISTSGTTSRSIAVRNIGMGRFGMPESIGSAGPLSMAKAEDVAFADGDVGGPAMAIRKAVPANTSGTDGDYEMLQMNAGRLWVSTVIEASQTIGANQGTANTAANAWMVKHTDGTNVGAVKAANALPTAADPAMVVVMSPNVATRNITTYFMVTMVALTNTDALQSLTGHKSNAVVTATTTPAVITTGTKFVVTAVTMAFMTTAAAGVCRFTLRANTAGVVAIGSPAVVNWFIGGNSSATAGLVSQMTIPIPDGSLVFAAGTGLGISALGYNATQVATATGYAQISLHGYEVAV